jgi:carboxypeptidase family protein
VRSVLNRPGNKEKSWTAYPYHLARVSNYDQAMRSVAGILLAGLIALPSAFAQQLGAEVHGTTLDARTSQTLAMVDVRLGGRAHMTRSDATGHFSITGLGPGDYVLQAGRSRDHIEKGDRVGHCQA